MKCPKCGYLGFDDVERCRNCGYDFSLSSNLALPDLTIRRDTSALTPLDDLSLVDSSVAAEPRSPLEGSANLDRLLGAPDPKPSGGDHAFDAKPFLRDRAADLPRPRVQSHAGAAAAAPAASAAAELPLFVAPILDDEPLIRRAPPPRAPLAVRRSTPDVSKVRDDAARAASFDLVLDESSPASRVSPAERAVFGAWSDAGDDEGIVAGVGARLVAVVIDLMVLAAIDVLVIYLTMQICGLSMADLDILPKGPLVAFLLVQNGGYLVAFTAGGQTLGKMVAGIRVVAADSEMPLDLGRAFLRTFMWVLLAMPAGLGFVSAIVSRDRRGLHDRFAGTRVVRASV